MKTLRNLLLASLTFFAVQAQAATFSLAMDGSAGSNLVATASQVYDLTVVAGATDAVTVRFYDTTYAHAVWTNAAYTTRTSYATNISVLSTNDYGIITTNSQAVLWTTSSSVAANTNNTHAVMATISVPAGAQTTIIGPFNFVRGVTAIPTTNCTVMGSYKSLF